MRFGACNWLLDKGLAPSTAFLVEAGFLEAYHVNIAEAYPARVTMEAGERLFLVHVFDSNRQVVGWGHTEFLALMRALFRIGCQGEVIVKCTAAGPDPFTAVKGDEWRDEVQGTRVAAVASGLCSCCIGAMEGGW